MKGMFFIIGGNKKGVVNAFVDVRLPNNVDALFMLLLKCQLEIENKCPSLYMPNIKAMTQVHHMRYIIQRCTQISSVVVWKIFLMLDVQGM